MGIEFAIIMMRRALLLGLAVLGADVGAQEVFRCSAPDGKVTYQQAPCPTSSAETKVDATPANTGYDPSKREQILREGAEAGKKLEARAAAEAEAQRKRAEQRALDEERLRQAEAREEAREYPLYNAWPAGTRPAWGGWTPRPPTPPGLRPQPVTPGK